MLFCVELAMGYQLFLTSNGSFALFFGIHILCFIAVVLLTLFCGEPWFWAILTLSLPIAGLWIAVLNSSLKDLSCGKDLVVQQDFDVPLRFSSPVARVGWERELNTMSLHDRLKLSDENEKKQSLIQFRSDDLEVKVRVLRKALRDSSPEVVHYAAVTLNAMEQEIDNKLNQLKGQYAVKASVTLAGDLIETMNGYIESGLISDQVLQLYRRQLLDWIREYESREDLPYELRVVRAQVLMDLKDDEQALQEYQELVREHPGRHEAFVGLMELHFRRGEYSQLPELTRRLKDFSLPREIAGRVAFWTLHEGA